jgi:hypothetical protein
MQFAEGVLREYLHQVQDIREEINNLVQRYPDEHFERICIATHTNVSGDHLLADKLAQAREGIAMCARRIQFAEGALRECLHLPIPGLLPAAALVENLTFGPCALTVSSGCARIARTCSA